MTATPEATESENRFERGLATRRAVLGTEYVDKALSSATDYSFPMQKYATEVCWDEIWNRPGLTHAQRSLLNLGMITALGRMHELRLHIRGAVNNGLTAEEIREVFLQAAVYCGLPAAMDGFRVAQEVLKEMGKLP